ncbi:unnamed protein product [Microthlaspi erraticum]|uniref:HSF-type DNA-binding domain-containing protein n=1 Tax=Microthlaspi erraticum TaxID=1685480 RepID=A0A6D2IXL5_9BRAS|nr:unnamed protein product [Microthlaspi erraticum]
MDNGNSSLRIDRFRGARAARASSFGKEFFPPCGLVERLSGFTKVESGQSEFSCDAFVKGQPPGITIPPAIHGMIASSLEYKKRKRLGLDSSSSNHRLPREFYESGTQSRSYYISEKTVYDMVDDSSTDSIVSWSESGKSFVVWNEVEFVKDVLPRCLPFTEMGYFTRWLEGEGFTKVDERLEFAEDYFLRGQPELTRPLTCGGFYISPETRRGMERMVPHLKAWLQNHQADKSV